MIHIQSALESGQEARIVQIDFSAAYERVNHQGILYKLCSVGIRGSALFILTVSIRQITALLGGWFWSKLVNVVSGVIHGSIMGPL